MHGGYSGKKFKTNIGTIEPMNRVVRDAWLVNLRSGEYRQATGRLVRRSLISPDNRAFCCLGVLCDMAVKAGIVEYDALGENFYVTDSEGARYDVLTGVLPETVARWAGLSSDDPFVKLSNSDHPLSYLNDRLELDFQRIADAIERSL